MSFIKKIRKKPEKEKLKILWISTTVMGIFLIIFWVFYLKFSLKKIDFKNLPLPTINTQDFKKAKEDFQKIEEEMKKIEELQQSLKSFSESIPPEKPTETLPENSVEISPTF